MRRWIRGVGGRRALDVALAVYLAVVAWGVFGPSPGDQLDEAGDRIRQVEAEVRDVADGGGGGSTGDGDEDRLFEGVSAEDVGNVAMFVPLGVLFPLRWRRWAWWTVPAGIALSGAIELTQLVLLSWRSPDLTDVRFNSLGAVVGFVLWLVWRAAHAWRRRDRM